MKKTMRILISFSLLAAISACSSPPTTYKRTMTNAKGEGVTCEASGQQGLLSDYILKRGFDSCVEDARAQGFNSAGKTKD